MERYKGYTNNMTKMPALSPDMQILLDQMIEAIELLPIKYLHILLQEYKVLPESLPLDAEYKRLLAEAEQILYLYRNFGDDAALDYVEKLAENQIIFYHNTIGEC